MSTEAITQSIITDITAAPSSDAGTVTIPEGEATGAATIQPEGDSDLASRLAIIAKKERAFMEKQKSLTQKMKELEERNSKLSQWEEYEKLLEENPNEFFKKKGMSFSDVQEKMLKSLSDEDLNPLEKMVKELQTKLENKDSELKKLVEEQFSQRDQAAKEREIEEQSKIYSARLKEFLTEKAEDYDLINAFEAGDEVFNVIKTVYLKSAEKGTPKLLSFEEACNLYEKKLEETVQGMKKSKKVSRLFGVQDSDDPIANMYGQTTIDDSFSQSSATSPQLKTEEERLRAAAKLLEQQFKSL